MNAIHTFNDECPSMCIWWDRLYVAELLLFWANEGKLRFNLCDYLVVSSPHYIATVENKLKAFYCHEVHIFQPPDHPFSLSDFKNRFSECLCRSKRKKDFTYFCFCFYTCFLFILWQTAWVTQRLMGGRNNLGLWVLLSVIQFLSVRLLQCLSSCECVCVTLSFWG